MFEILTVCTGNICRSPLAELLLADALADLGVRVSSAGTAGLVDAHMPDQMQAIAARMGVDPAAAAAHRSRPLTEDDLVSPDLILGMSRNHRRKIARLAPTRVREAFTLREYARLAAGLTHGEIRRAAEAAGVDAAARVRAVSELVSAQRGLSLVPHDLSDDDIIDPYGRSDETYELSTQQIAAALDVVERVLRVALSPAPADDPTGAGQLIGGVPAATAVVTAPDMSGRRSGGGSGSSRHGRGGKRRRRWIPWVASIGGLVLVLLVVGAIAGVTFYKQAESARADLMTAKAKIATVPALIKADDTAGLHAVASDVQTLTRRALHTTSGPLWDIAAGVPVVGANISAVQKTTEAADILVEDALPPAVTLMSSLQTKQLKLKGGGISLKPFEQAQKDLPTINDAFGRAQAVVSGIDKAALLPPVRDAIGGLLDIVDQTAPTLKTVQRILPMLLPMAGSDGPRQYLLIFQNNAEIRATGGNASATMLVTVNQGRISLADQSMTEKFVAAGTYNQVFTKLPKVVTKLYLPTFTSHPQDFTFTPNFPTTATLFRNLWKGTTGDSVDGVISIDPVVLSQLLQVTGPVKVAGDTLTSKNVVKALLSDAYERFPKGADSDAYFTKVSAAVFAKLTAGDWDPTAMLEQLQKAAHDQRVYAWFADKKEQALAVEAGVDGALATSNKEHTQVGVFLNDYTVGKLEYWLKTKVSVTCDVAKRTVTTSIDLTNRIPNGDFSNYTLGYRDGQFGQPRTTMLLDVLFFAPTGATLGDTQTGGHGIPSLSRTGTDNGRSAKSVTVIVPKGTTRTVTSTSTLPKGELGPLSVRYTPTVTDTPVTIAPSCGGF